MQEIRDHVTGVPIHEGFTTLMEVTMPRYVRKNKSLHHITVEGCLIETRLDSNIDTGHISIYSGHRFRDKEETASRGERWYAKNTQLAKDRARQQRIDNKDELSLYWKRYRRACPLDRRTYVTREGACIHLNEWFVGCRRHHVDPNTIVHIPTEIHTRHQHNIRTGYGMDIINALAFEFLFGQVEQ